MRVRWLICAASCVACAPTYRAELVANVRGAVAAAQGPALSVQVPIDNRGSFRRLKWVLALPRALELEYSVTCSGAGTVAHGRDGETYESYRQRRLAELSQQRAANARAIGGLVGAVVPVQKGEVAGGVAQATVDPGQATAQAALQVLPTPQLAAGDVGARTIQRELDVSAAQPGSCVLSFESKQPSQDLTGVTVDATVVRLTDVDAEQRAHALARRQAEDRAGHAIRVRLIGRLVALGADPQRRSKGSAEPLAVRVEGEQRAPAAPAGLQSDANQNGGPAGGRSWVRWEPVTATGAAQPGQQPAPVQAQPVAPPDAQAQARAAALAVRRRVLSYLEALGANPLWRWSQELARAQAAEDERRRAQWQREQVAARAQLEMQTALALRRSVVVVLMRAGADPGLRARLADEERRRRDEAQRRSEAERAQADARKQREALAAAAQAERQAWEASQRARLELAAAYSIRSRVLAGLRSLGADPEFRKRTNEREIRAWEAEVQGRQQAARDADAQRTREIAAALAVRQSVKMRLIALGADPELRARLQLQRWQEEQPSRAGPSAEAESVPSVAAQVGPSPTPVVVASEPGTIPVASPPSPPATPIEIRPPAPHPGAVWIAGRFTWTGAAWVWMNGHYELPPAAGLGAPSAVDVHIDLGAASLDVGGKAATRPAPPPTPPRHPSGR